MAEPALRAPRTVGGNRLPSISIDRIDYRPSQSHRLYHLLPQQFWISPLDHPLLDILAADTPEIDGIAARMGARFDRLNGAKSAPDPKLDQFVREQKQRFEALHAEYDKRTGPEKRHGTFQLRKPLRHGSRDKPVKGWLEGIETQDVRACILAAAILLHRTGYFVAPATIMALWAIEGKGVRDKYYHDLQFLEDVRIPGGARKNITALWYFNYYLDKFLGNADVPDDRKKPFPLNERQTRKTTFNAVTADESRYRWWAWSNMMPHFWSMDWAVLRFPGKFPDDLPVPPSRGGNNVRNFFHAWLSGRRASIHAFQTDADIQAVVDYCGTAQGGFSVKPTTTSDQDLQQAWPVRIKATEVHRLVPLFLFLQASYFIDLKSQIAARVGVEGHEIPDWPTYVAYNSKWGVGKLERPPTDPDRRARLLAAWDAPVLSGESRVDKNGKKIPGSDDRTLFRGNATDESRANALRFLFLKDVLTPLMHLPWRDEE